jgi:hypothetical protein
MAARGEQAERRMLVRFDLASFFAKKRFPLLRRAL